MHLEVNNVSKAFSGVVAVDRCSLGIRKHSITTLIGPNGAGKSTLFNCISNVVPVDSGEIWYDGRRIDQMPPHRIAQVGIGRSFQLTRTLDDLSVLENLVLHTASGVGTHLLRWAVSGRDHQRAEEMMEFLNISHLAQLEMGALSFGQKKLLDLGAVLMADPELILLDEPAAGVNPRLLEDIMEKIGALRESGKTVVIVEHNMEVVMNLSDEVVVMAEGRVIARDVPEVIRNNDEVLDTYLGRPKAA